MRFSSSSEISSNLATLFTAVTRWATPLKIAIAPATFSAIRTRSPMPATLFPESIARI